jgi:ABC-2 type transport system ATP-binding protein
MSSTTGDDLASLSPTAGAFHVIKGPPDDWTFRVDALTKQFGALAANDDITLRVEPGEVYGLLGPNGAGKSTLVKQTIGLLKPTSGRITLGRFDLVADPDAARQLCSYLPQVQMPIDSFHVSEAIGLAGRIRGGSARDIEARTASLIDALDLGEWRGSLGRGLSGGVRRLVGFCMAIVRPGRLVILDEPTNDVDPLRRRLLWEEIRALGAHGCAVLLVTHNVLEAEKSVDRLAVIHKGRLVAEGTPSSMKAADRSQLRLQLMLTPGAITPDLPPWAGPPVRVGNNLVTNIAEADASTAIAWAAEMTNAGVAEEYALAAMTLEDAYIRLTSHGRRHSSRPHLRRRGSRGDFVRRPGSMDRRRWRGDGVGRRAPPLAPPSATFAGGERAAVQPSRRSRQDRATRTTPQVATAHATDIRAMVPTRFGGKADAAEPDCAPRNQGADEAIAPHHTAVAAVITNIATLSATASTASADRTGRASTRRRVTATAATVHSASAKATRSAVGMMAKR